MTDDLQPSGLKPRPHLYPVRASLPDQSTSVGPKVAVIMRTKNRPLLLHRALGSVLLQRHEAWHLYLVNDGGDRGEFEEVVTNYHYSFDNRITVFHHSKSLGMEQATNAALSRVTEDLVVIHDDDDSWDPDFLSATSTFLARPENCHQVGVITGCTLIYEKIELANVYEVSRRLWPHARDVIDFRSMLVNNMFPPICLVFRRSVVDLIGGFNGFLPVLGDWEFNIRLLLVGDIGFIDRPLANYHHRMAGTNSIYSNTVVDGTAVHERQNILLRNSMLRSALAERPEMLGLLQPVLHALGDLERRMMHVCAADNGRLERIEIHLEEMRQILLALRQMLKPVRWLWRRILPIRSWLSASSRSNLNPF